jgi:hypothetical protein
VSALNIASAAETVATVASSPNSKVGYFSALRALIPTLITIIVFAVLFAQSAGVICLNPQAIVQGRPVPDCTNDFHKFMIFLGLNWWNIIVSSLIGPLVKGGADTIINKYFKNGKT